MNEYIHIGKVVAAHGVAGELKLVHSLGKKLMFKPGDVLFVEERKGAELPHFIQSSKATAPDENIILLEGITTRERARLLVNKKVWLAQEDFRKHASKRSAIAMLGYTLVHEGTPLGVIEAIIEQPHQVLLRLVIDAKEVLIPLHEETLDSINHTKKEVHVTLPDGLLDVYLGA